jgi:hypothetical protein
MIDQVPPAERYRITEHLFNIIDGLSPDMQFDLYIQLIQDRVSVELFKLIIDMSDEERKQFLEQLREAPAEAGPIQAIDLD